MIGRNNERMRATTFKRKSHVEDTSIYLLTREDICGYYLLVESAFQSECVIVIELMTQMWISVTRKKDITAGH